MRGWGTVQGRGGAEIQPETPANAPAADEESHRRSGASLANSMVSGAPIQKRTLALQEARGGWGGMDERLFLPACKQRCSAGALRSRRSPAPATSALRLPMEAQARSSRVAAAAASHQVFEYWSARKAYTCSQWWGKRGQLQQAARQ